MRALTRLALVLPTVALFALASCGAPQRRGEAFLDDLPPPMLLPASALPVDVALRQRVSARWATGDTAFDAVVQRHQGALKLVALSPMGQPGFVLTLGPEGEVTVENRTGQDLPFRAERILADVQKVFYPWLEAPSDDDAVHEGSRRGVVGELVVEERVSEGRLVERRFFDPSDPSSPAVTVRYVDWADRRVAPAHAELTHERLGYQLSIETMEEISLPGG